MNDDVIFELLKLLSIKDILNCSLVSKQFYKVTKNEVLWKGNIKLFGSNGKKIGLKYDMGNEVMWKENVNNVIKFNGSYYESFKFNYGLKMVRDGLNYEKSIMELSRCLI
jgi:hypothetical protein